MNSKHYWIYTSKNGERFIQTKNKYLAHALSYMRFQFMTFDDVDSKIYSFHYSEELIQVIEHINSIRNS